MNNTKTLRELFKDNENGKLVLPNFQRGYEWKEYDQKLLLSTVLVKLPIGGLLLLEGNRGEFATRQLCYESEDFDQAENCLYLLDGQQRTSTLRAIFSNLYGTTDQWEHNYDELYKKLRYRWFINVKKIDNEDIFGFENLSFKKLDRLEPGQVFDKIEYKKIIKGNKDAWHHPAFSIVRNGEYLEGISLKNEIAKCAAEEGIIPFYELYSSDEQSNTVLEYTLGRIARARVEDLKVEVEQGSKTLTELMGQRNPEVVSYEGRDQLDTDEKTELEHAWSSLAADWKKDVLQYLEGVLDQELHVIQLPSDEISRATSIYENINKGGKGLDTYDLIVAKAAAGNRSERTLTQRIASTLSAPINLSDGLVDPLNGSVNREWAATQIGAIDDKKIVNPIREQYLNLLSIFSHVDYGDFSNFKVDLIKKEKHLELNADQINQNTELTTVSLVRALAFLQFRCGKLSINDLNYKLMLLPLAYVLKEEEHWESRSTIAKLEYWYWASLFGGSYREKQNQQCIEDIRSLYDWVNGGENPFRYRFTKILSSEGYSDRDVLLLESEEREVVPAAIRKGLLEYVLSTQPRDFNPHRNIPLNAWDIAKGVDVEHEDGVERQLKVHDHHIYPLGARYTIDKTAKELRNNSDNILNSPLNRTYISDYSNSKIRDKSPEDYFNYLSDITSWGHAIGLNWNRAEDEEMDDFHKRLLSNRYERLLESIKSELTDLENVEDLQGIN
ncbi:DUF262 domain-containing protein [Halobacillus litoralis]|uniref:DUF262 domain-containing protein n=1 Tax=Halobacillus litoralis TaxID=45668 RepID=UPI001CD41FE2|nr:DUF262 domain-containing protein [Halobacillus litoralis]MCA0972258.1 DUF262 domain-containing protein [Halobacillus litoralis]